MNEGPKTPPLRRPSHHHSSTTPLSPLVLQMVSDNLMSKYITLKSEAKSLIRRLIESGYGPILKATLTMGDSPLIELLTMYEEEALAVSREGDKEMESDSGASETELSFED